MAAITNTENIEKFLDKAVVFTWVLTTADPIGDAIEMPGWADRSVHAFGTMGGATVTVEGSNENPTDPPVNFAPLNDHFGAAIGLTLDGEMAGIAEIARTIRPRLNPVGAGASITVKIMVRRQP